MSVSRNCGEILVHDCTPSFWNGASHWNVEMTLWWDRSKDRGITRARPVVGCMSISQRRGWERRSLVCRLALENRMLTLEYNHCLSHRLIYDALTTSWGSDSFCSFCRWNEESPETRLLHKIPKSRSSPWQSLVWKTRNQARLKSILVLFWPRRGLFQTGSVPDVGSATWTFSFHPSVRKIDLGGLGIDSFYSQRPISFVLNAIRGQCINHSSLIRPSKAVFLSYWMSREEIRECSALWNTSIDRHIQSCEFKHQLPK